MGSCTEASHFDRMDHNYAHASEVTCVLNVPLGESILVDLLSTSPTTGADSNRHDVCKPRWPRAHPLDAVNNSKKRTDLLTF